MSMNPLQYESPERSNNSGGGTSRMSEAMLQSMKLASQSPSQLASDRPQRPPNRLGYRAIIAAVLLFGGGLTLLITGCVFYWHTKLGERSTGFDMIIVALIMLLPGSYAAILLYGNYNRWRGYLAEDLEN